jgi:MFS family permease
MTLHAIDDIGDAIDATKSFLLPVAARTWLKLAFVVFFIGGGGLGLNGVQNANNFDGQEPAPGTTGEFQQPVTDGTLPTLDALSTEVLAILAIVLGLILFGLLVGLLSNFMEFVFVQSLASREIHVRQYVRENLGNGLRLLAFRLAVSLVSLLLTVGFLYTIFVTVFGGNVDAFTVESLFGVLPLVIAFFVVVALVQGLVTGFTTVFVVPMMLTGDRGILGSWRRLLSSIRSNLKQYLVYVFFSVVLGIGVGIVGSIVGAILVLLLLVPFVLVAAVIWLALGQTTVGFVLLALVGVLFALALLLVTNLVKVPLQAFLRYYAMLVLGDVDESLDPIPEVRADIRAGDFDETDSSAAEGP